MSKFSIVWEDSGKEPQCPPNPQYPNGIDLPGPAHASHGTCKVDLPYPAKRIGFYVIECMECGYRVGCTTAGRVDDPRSITLACRGKRNG